MAITEMTEKLDSLEAKITRLKQEYEQYFMRLLKREPIVRRKEVEGLILRYTNMTINNTADQFKLNCLLSRFNSYRQYWSRILRSMEEGTYVRRSEGSGLTSAAEAAATGEFTEEQGAGQGPEAMKEELSPLYEKYINARKRCNAGVRGLSEEKFRASIKRARERIASTYNVKDTEVTVIEKDGQVKLAIRPRGVKVK
ncbi:MAG: MXAN_5187 C-terminal domain-containing protein [Thermodesulfobacteriota bacterium]